MKFEIGEVVVGCGFIHYPERNGMECEILSPPEHNASTGRKSGIKITGIHYWVKWSDGVKTLQPQNTLRKKPKFEASSWESEVFNTIGWNPTKEKIS